MKYFIIIKEKSTRVPNKTFINLGGKPLWKHLIDKLKNKKVFIDTDSNKIIQEVANTKNIYAYFRQKKHIQLETDSVFEKSPVLLMINRFVTEFVSNENEIIVTPHITSPFIKVKTIEQAAQKLKEGYDSVQACTKHHEFAYYKGQPINFNQNVVNKTQNLEPIIFGNGAFFIFSKKTFTKYKNRIGSNPFFYNLSFKESIEIDTIQDYELARKYVK